MNRNYVNTRSREVFIYNSVITKIQFSNCYFFNFYYYFAARGKLSELMNTFSYIPYSQSSVFFRVFADKLCNTKSDAP